MIIKNLDKNPSVLFYPEAYDKLLQYVSLIKDDVYFLCAVNEKGSSTYIITDVKLIKQTVYYVRTDIDENDLLNEDDAKWMMALGKIKSEDKTIPTKDELKLFNEMFNGADYALYLSVSNKGNIYISFVDFIKNIYFYDVGYDIDCAGYSEMTEEEVKEEIKLKINNYKGNSSFNSNTSSTKSTFSTSENKNPSLLAEKCPDINKVV